MKRAFLSLFVVGFLGCGGGADEARVDAISALEGDVSAGATVYAAQCERCHLAGGVGGDLGPSVVSAGKTATIEITLTGEDTMPSFDSLSDQEIADCTAYILSL